MKQCSSCGLAWRNLLSNLCGRCSQLRTSGLAQGCSKFNCTCQGFAFISVSTDVEKLMQTALDTSHVAHAQAVDARMNKQGLPPTIHTTSGLSAAKANNNPTSENKIFISIECHLKSSSHHEQNNTDADCGHWGKPWGKDDYLSGKTFLRCHYVG